MPVQERQEVQALLWEVDFAIQPTVSSLKAI